MGNCILKNKTKNESAKYINKPKLENKSKDDDNIPDPPKLIRGQGYKKERNKFF